MPTQKREKEEERCGDDKKQLISKSSTKGSKSSTGVDSNSKKTPVKLKEDIKVDGEWTICYATQKFRPHEFFDGQIPAEGVTLEELRQEMEKEFFEFSKDRTYWDIDKERKLLFPSSRGTAKGVIDRC